MIEVNYAYHLMHALSRHILHLVKSFFDIEFAESTWTSKTECLAGFHDKEGKWYLWCAGYNSYLILWILVKKLSSSHKFFRKSCCEIAKLLTLLVYIVAGCTFSARRCVVRNLKFQSVILTFQIIVKLLNARQFPALTVRRPAVLKLLHVRLAQKTEMTGFLLLIEIIHKNWLMPHDLLLYCLWLFIK